MREHKYQAWIPQLNKMIQVISHNFEVGGTWFNDKDGKEGFIHDGAILRQWTGLKDKSGKEIYEGDVLLFNNAHSNAKSKNWKCVVVYRDGAFVCEYPVDGVYNHFASWNYPTVTWEVIGNIYEHPNLLEGAAS